MRNLFLILTLILLATFSLKAQNLTKREVYQSMEIGQRQLIHKTIYSYWDYSLNRDTVELHQFLGWLDTTSTPGVWVGEWAVYPCRMIVRYFDQGNGNYISDDLYFIAGNAANETRTIADMDSLYNSTYYAAFDMSDAILVDSTSEFLVGDPSSCLDSLEEVTKQFTIFGFSSSGGPRYSASKAKQGVGEVWYMDSIPNDNIQMSAYPKYYEKREQILFEDSNGQCVDEAIVFKESIAEEGLALNDIYNFSIGDEFIYSTGSGSHDGLGGWHSCHGYEYIIITDKQESVNQYTYTYNLHRWGTCGSSSGGDSSSYDEWVMNLTNVYNKIGFLDPSLNEIDGNPMGVLYDTLCNQQTWKWSWESWDFKDTWGNYSSNSVGYGIGLGRIKNTHNEMNYSNSRILIDFRKSGLACGDWMEMSIQRDQRIEDWTVFPTLTRDEVHFVIPDNAKGVTLQVSDQFGRLLESHQAGNFNGGEINTLNFSQNPDGLYFLSLWVDGVLQGTRRVIKIQ